MAVTEEIARLILEADTKGFADAQKKILDTRTELDTLTANYKAGAIGVDEYIKKGGRLQSELDELKDAYKFAGDAAKKFGSNAAAASALADAAGRATNKMAGLGQAGLQTGRVIQDFAQGGVAGVINNIEGLTQAIGGGAGLAGMLTILGTAFFVLKPVFAEFMKSVGGENAKPILDTADAVGMLSKRIKELEGKPVKIQIDVEEIERAKAQVEALKKGLAEAEAAKSGRTADEKAAGDQFTKQFEATGGEGAKAFEAVERQMGDAFVARDAGAKEARKAFAERQRRISAAQRALAEANQRRDAALASGDADSINMLTTEAGSRARDLDLLRDPEAVKTLADNVRAAEKRAREAGVAEAGNTFGAVKRGNDPLARDVMAERFREAGQDRFAAMVEGASPQAVAAKREADRLAAEQTKSLDKHNAEQSRLGMEARKKAEDERIRQADEAARELENDPAIKAELERNRLRFGERGGLSEEAAAKAAQMKAQAEGAKADRAPLNPQAIAAAEETQAIMRENLNITRQMAMQIQQVRARNRQLAAETAQLQRFIDQPGPSPLPAGRR